MTSPAILRCREVPYDPVVYFSNEIPWRFASRRTATISSTRTAISPGTTTCASELCATGTTIQKPPARMVSPSTSGGCVNGPATSKTNNSSVWPIMASSNFSDSDRQGRLADYERFASMEKIHAATLAGDPPPFPIWAISTGTRPGRNRGLPASRRHLARPDKDPNAAIEIVKTKDATGTVSSHYL